MVRRIIIRKIEMPKTGEVEEDLRWMFESLGLKSGRDTEETSFKVLCELLEQLSEDRLIATENLAKSLNMEPPRINHHIRNLMDTGMFQREKRKIALSGGSLTAAIDEMRRESDAMFDRISEVAKRIDETIGY
jgi:predicted transcriptional regulator